MSESGFASLDHYRLHGDRLGPAPTVTIRRAAGGRGNGLAVLQRLIDTFDEDSPMRGRTGAWFTELIREGLRKSQAFQDRAEAARRRTAMRKVQIVAIVLRHPGLHTGRLHQLYQDRHGRLSYTRLYDLMRELEAGGVLVGHRVCAWTGWTRNWKVTPTKERAHHV